MFASPHLEKTLLEYSSLILQHHLLFRESRWEGWGLGGCLNGKRLWKEGVAISVCACVCVRAGVRDD